MSNLMEQLNEAQLRAVLHKDGPLLVIAGAGTGKTHAITQKIGYMIEQGWAAPEEILALTFTEKAANEMEERVDRLLPMGYVDLWISTFHGFAEKIIKAHGLDIGLATNFKLLNEFEQWRLIQKNLERFKLDYYRPAGNPTKFIEALLRNFSRLKDENISPADYLAYTQELQRDSVGVLADAKVKKPARGKKAAVSLTALDKLRLNLEPEEVTEEMLAQEVARLSEIANAYAVYQQLLFEEGAMDFGDLINHCLKLFRERPLILAAYQEKFRYVIVDEFQDTNWSQYELVKLLAGKRCNIIVVGDDDQAIYRFRGASMSNILQFKDDYPEAEQVVLTENYRSYQEILDLSYEFIKLNNPNRLEWQLGQAVKKTRSSSVGALDKKLVAHKGRGAEISVLEGLDLPDEVAQVIKKIAQLKEADQKLSWSDFAILVRANDSAKDFCEALEKEALPYQFMASRGLYAKPIILDLVAYLKLLDDYHESRAMYRVLCLPMFKFTQKELVDFNYQAGKKTWSLFETLRKSDSLPLGPETRKKIVQVLSLISKHAQSAKERRVSEVIIDFVNDSGYLDYLASLSGREQQENISYLNQFLKRAQDFEAANDEKTTKAFLEEFELELRAGEEGRLSPDMEIGPDTIKIMTVHASKGLEFEYVFIANMVDKRFPAIARREAIAVPDALVKEILPEGDVHLEEERRLFYVAMTRARQGLYFSWAPDYGGARPKKPSRFLEEIGLVVQQKTGRTKMAELDEAFRQSGRKGKPSDNQQEVAIMPKFFSYSQLAAFQSCPYKYRFAHILKIPMRGKSVFSFGKTMHSTLQKMFELLRERRGASQSDLFGQLPQDRQQISLDEALKFYDDSWIDEWYESKSQKEEYLQNGRRIIKDFYRLHQNNWPDNRLTEKGFNLKVAASTDAYTVRGQIDRIDALPDGRIKIIDYKTGEPKSRLVFEDKEQLLIYQLAAQEVFKEEVGLLAFHYLEDNSELEFVGTPDELAKVKVRIVETIEQIKQGSFEPKPSMLCKYCDFASICQFRKN